MLLFNKTEFRESDACVLVFALRGYAQRDAASNAMSTSISMKSIFNEIEFIRPSWNAMHKSLPRSLGLLKSLLYASQTDKLLIYKKVPLRFARLRTTKVSPLSTSSIVVCVTACCNAVGASEEVRDCGKRTGADV